MKYIIIINTLFLIACNSSSKVRLINKQLDSHLQLDIIENKSLVTGVSIPTKKEKFAVCFDEANTFRHETENGVIIIKRKADNYLFSFESEEINVYGKMKILPILFKEYVEKINIYTYTVDEIEVFTFQRLYKIDKWKYFENGIEQIIDYSDKLSVYESKYDDYCKDLN